MYIYSTLLTLHIVFAGIWLAFFIVEPVLKRKIKSNYSDKGNIENYLGFTNSFGIAGALGILITGILLVLNSGYGFFDMSNNHWLASKQIILVIILIMTGVFVIPTSKQIKSKLSLNTSDDITEQMKKLFKLNLIINILVLLNFLFAVTHRLY